MAAGGWEHAAVPGQLVGLVGLEDVGELADAVSRARAEDRAELHWVTPLGLLLLLLLSILIIASGAHHTVACSDDMPVKVKVSVRHYVGFVRH